MTYGSLFAGIGGFDLGFERAGMTCKWQVENNEYAARVLAKHWPDVARYRDVRYFLGSKRWRRARSAWSVDVICGGFPCQDISLAGRGGGIDGEKSGLWVEYARIVRLLRPRFVVVENSPALTGRGLDRVLGDLASCGYDAEWDCLPAAAAGAPHLRDRIYIVGHADRHDGRAWRSGRSDSASEGQPVTVGPFQTGADADGERREEQHIPALAARAGQPHRAHHADGVRIYPDRLPTGQLQDGANGGAERRVPQLVGGCGGSWESWRTEPTVGRVADGVPNRVDRLRGLGNAVVPQVAEWVGRRLMEAR
jgi:DNA (cytosine-5)-methyltransferase 1